MTPCGSSQGFEECYAKFGRLSADRSLFGCHGELGQADTQKNKV